MAKCRYRYGRYREAVSGPEIRAPVFWLVEKVLRCVLTVEDSVARKAASNHVLEPVLHLALVAGVVAWTFTSMSLSDLECIEVSQINAGRGGPKNV